MNSLYLRWRACRDAWARSLVVSNSCNGQAMDVIRGWDFHGIPPVLAPAILVNRRCAHCFQPRLVALPATKACTGANTTAAPRAEKWRFREVIVGEKQAISKARRRDEGVLRHAGLPADEPFARSVNGQAGAPNAYAVLSAPRSEQQRINNGTRCEIRQSCLAHCSSPPPVPPAAAQSVGDFYKGKQIEFIIAAETGSIYDTWARMLSRHMPKYVPGNPAFVPKNMPGAGHIRAAGYSFNVAPKDGTSIVTFSHNIPASYMLKNPGHHLRCQQIPVARVARSPWPDVRRGTARAGAAGGRTVRARTAGRRRRRRRRHQPDTQARQRSARHEDEARGGLQGRRRRPARGRTRRGRGHVRHRRRDRERARRLGRGGETEGPLQHGAKADPRAERAVDLRLRQDRRADGRSWASTARPWNSASPPRRRPAFPQIGWMLCGGRWMPR